MAGRAAAIANININYWRRGRTAALLNLQIGIDAKLGSSLMPLRTALVWMFTNAMATDVMVDGLTSLP